MKFYLGPQNLEANTPLPTSAMSCNPSPPASGQTGLGPQDKGLIAIGTVLGALLAALAIFLLLKCFRNWPRRTVQGAIIELEPRPPTGPEVIASTNSQHGAGGSGNGPPGNELAAGDLHGVVRSPGPSNVSPSGTVQVTDEHHSRIRPGTPRMGSVG
jgi:hypothetical protein